jgi:VanZ family protein
MNHFLSIINQHRRILYTSLVLYWVILLILTSVPTTSLPKVGINDKIQHFFAYFVLAVLLNLSLYVQRKYQLLSNIKSLLSLLIIIIYAIIDEVHQHFIPGRFCEFFDFAADILGGIAGVLLIHFLFRKKKTPDKT